MTDYANPVELRKLLIVFLRSPAGGTQEDNEYMTIHFAKITGGAIDAGWVSGDYSTIENAFLTAWTTLKALVPATTQFIQFRWYKDGPTQSPTGADGPNNPSVRTAAPTGNVPGTAGAGAMLPPQCAISVTKIASARIRWGRMYLPGPLLGTISTNDGRLVSANADTIRGAFVTWLNACRAAGLKPVVWSRGKNAYDTPKGVHIAAHTPTAYEVTAVQVDNIIDVIRMRRWDSPTYRTQVALT